MGRTRRDSMISHYQKPDRAYQSTDEGLFTRMVLVIQQYAWAKQDLLVFKEKEYYNKLCRCSTKREKFVHTTLRSCSTILGLQYLEPPHSLQSLRVSPEGQGSDTSFGVSNMDLPIFGLYIIRCNESRGYKSIRERTRFYIQVGYKIRVSPARQSHSIIEPVTIVRTYILLSRGYIR